MTDEQIQELVLDFLDSRGGYVAGASERELFLMVKRACAAERERVVRAMYADEQTIQAALEYLPP